MSERYTEVVLTSTIQGLHDNLASDSFVASDGYTITRSADGLDVLLTHRSGDQFVVPWASVRKAVPAERIVVDRPTSDRMAAARAAKALKHATISGGGDG